MLFDIHLWIGLSVGLLLVVAGVTGSLLVFDEEIDAALNPALLRVQPQGERVALQQIVDAVALAHPDQRVAYIRMPRAPEESFAVTTAGADPLQLYFDPYGGAFLGERGTTEGFTNALFDLHVHLLSGELGELVMGVVALLTLVLVATGAVVWWAGLRRWWDGFIVKRRANWKRINFDLHRASGIWTALFLLVTAFTGASLIFYQPFMVAADWFTASDPVPRPPTVTPQRNLQPLPVDSLLRLANRALPGGVVTYVSFPATPTAPLSIRKWFDFELHPNGRNFVYLDPWTGAVLGMENARTVPLGTKVDNLLYPLHIGSFGPAMVRVLYALFGLAPLILFVSGCVMWWNRNGGKRRRRGATVSRSRS